jgi:CRP-like cAMP-binding protein
VLPENWLRRPEERTVARSRNAEILSRIPLFARCNDKELAHLAGLCTQADFPVGSELTRQGDVGHEFFVLLSGTADVVRNGQVRATLGAGDHVGELALLDKAPRSATVLATSAVTAMVLGFAEFWEAIGSSAGMDKVLLASLAHQLREARGNQEDFADISGA